MPDDKLGFIALKSLKEGPLDSQAALAEIRRIYFKTTKRTVEHDLVHAIELLKTLETEEEREKATVYMHGLNEMYLEWTGGRGKGKGGRGKEEQSKSKSNNPKSKNSK